MSRPESWGEWAARAWDRFRYWLDEDRRHQREQSRRSLAAAMSNPVVIHPPTMIRIPRQDDMPPGIARALSDGAGGRWPDQLQVLTELYIDQGELGFMAVWREPEPGRWPSRDTEQLRVIVKLPERVVASARVLEQEIEPVRSWAERQLYNAVVEKLKDWPTTATKGSTTEPLPCPSSCAC